MSSSSGFDSVHPSNGYTTLLTFFPISLLANSTHCSTWAFWTKFFPKKLGSFKLATNLAIAFVSANDPSVVVKKGSVLVGEVFAISLYFGSLQATWFNFTVALTKAAVAKIFWTQQVYLFPVRLYIYYFILFYIFSVVHLRYKNK